ncbi:MAG: phosphatidate cytidylyltransferase [Deltaproteobacteria bacterium]|nr:phosphatidate cytidylyltransferase [Deltaproteobacteria bacterium]MBW2535713.1 phosphatidate cytidylyltransferase [Deltaproteobacteria bacterium]
MRFATAGVAVPLMLLLLFAGPPWGWLLFVMVAAAAGSIELFGMTHPGDRVAAAVAVLCAWAMMLAIYFHDREPRALLTVALLIALVSILLTLARLGEMRTAALRLVAATFGPMWIGGGVGALAAVRAQGEPHGAGYVLLALCLSWLSDTGGYFAGRFFGKRKLYPAVSPKKTIAGAVGGVVAATAGAAAFRYFFIPTMPWPHFLVLAVVASFLGQLGDLGESILKRSTGVKDSGGIVPGHGGMLDRIDAAMITSPLVLIYLLWFQ